MRAKKVDKIRNIEYYDFQQTLDNLYRDSLNGTIFTNLMTLIMSDDNIRLAFRNIKNNRGSKTPGVDGMKIKDVSNLKEDEYTSIIRNKLRNYHPKAVRREEIPKPNGKIRPLGIPTIVDRIIQQCILQILEPICEAKFAESSYGFRPNRSTENAIAHAYRFMQMQNLHYVVDVDIKGFFDNVSHPKLIKQIWNMGIQDKNLISIISKMLKAEIELTKGNRIKPSKGTPQGGILSPLLSNIVLNELDWWIFSQWQGFEMSNPTPSSILDRTDEGKGIDKSYQFKVLRSKSRLKEVYIVRYADDFKLFCRNYETANKIKIASTDWLNNRLGLEVSEDKSGITDLRKNYSEFLGIKMKLINKSGKWVVKSHMSDKAFNRTKENIRKLIIKLRDESGSNNESRIINEYNAMILGIHEYFNMATMITADCGKLQYNVLKMLKSGKLRRRVKKSGNGFNLASLNKRYLNSKQLRYVSSKALVPIGYLKHKNPMMKRKVINKYTPEGRAKIHKDLDYNLTQKIITLLKYPVTDRTVLYNDNRISLFVAQKGKCAVTDEELTVTNMRCHHKIRITDGGTDEYGNLIIVLEDVHQIIHCKDEHILQKYLSGVRIPENKQVRLNELRRLVGNDPINF